MTNRVDYFGADISELQNKKLFLFDMDGTIYEEDRLFEGTLELLDYIHNIGGEYIFITNNSSKSVVDYVEKVNRLGIKAERDNFLPLLKPQLFILKKIILNLKFIAKEQNL
ncbi:nagD protein [Streptococcus pneumoniae Netherlands15B-37]|nr:nagD protein [Streptococcus pneumoniae Netherlands15B-37]